MRNDKTLIVGWKHDLTNVVEIAAKYAQVSVIIFDESGLTYKPACIDSHIEFITFDQSQFSHRDKLLKAPAELAIWLYQNASFNRIYCSKLNGLGFFIAGLKRTVKCCAHWELQWFGRDSVFDEYAKSKRFFDKEGLLSSYLEEHQTLPVNAERLSHNKTSVSVSDVSVIIPFHNRVKYLPFTLDSLLKQERGFEVIIVNDASESREREELISLLKEPRFASLAITVIDSEVSLGASGARNKGVELASRDYVFFLDDDDILAPNTLRLCCDAIELENADVVTVAFSFFKGEQMPNLTRESGMLIQFHSAMDWSSALLYNCVGGISALYRKSVFKQAKGFKCAEFAGEEDWQLILKLAFAGKIITNIPLPLLWYRNTPFSLSKKMLRYESRQQLFELYKQVLPKPLANLPEFVTSTQHMQRANVDELAMLGWKLYPHKNKPLYVYGAGELGRAVLQYLCKLKPCVRIEKVIDRNAAFINEAMGFEVVKLEDCQFEPEAVVIIASLRFVNEITAQLPSSLSHVIRIDE